MYNIKKLKEIYEANAELMKDGFVTVITSA